MAEKAKEMILKLGDGYSQWDFIALACIVLINSSELLPQIKVSVKNIVGTMIDGNLQLKDMVRDGVLPFKS